MSKQREYNREVAETVAEDVIGIIHHERKKKTEAVLDDLRRPKSFLGFNYKQKKTRKEMLDEINSAGASLDGWKKFQDAKNLGAQLLNDAKMVDEICETSSMPKVTLDEEVMNRLKEFKNKYLEMKKRQGISIVFS